MNMKKIIALILTVVTLLTVFPVVLAADYNDTSYPLYIAESLAPGGYTYLFSDPDVNKRQNLGDHKNGEYVRMIRDAGNGWYYVVCSNGKEGYMEKNNLHPASETVTRDIYRVKAKNGYCYMRSNPNYDKAINLGRYNDGAYIVIINWNADPSCAAVMSPETNTYGYIDKNNMIPAGEYR